jgi:hypothetical protein
MIIRYDRPPWPIPLQAPAVLGLVVLLCFIGVLAGGDS